MCRKVCATAFVPAVNDRMRRALGSFECAKGFAVPVSKTYVNGCALHILQVSQTQQKPQPAGSAMAPQQLVDDDALCYYCLQTVDKKAIHL